MIAGNHGELLAKEEGWLSLTNASKIRIRHSSSLMFSARVSTIIISFGGTWKQAIDAVNREVMSSFPSFRTGASVLQQALTLLVQYYHRFQKILGDHLPSMNSRQDLVNIHQLMVEVKKYKPNF